MVFNKKKQISNTVATAPRDIFMRHTDSGWKSRTNSKIRVTFKDIVQSIGDER